MPKSSSILSPHKIPKNSFDLLRLLFSGTVVIAHFMALSGEVAFLDILPFFDTTVAVMGFFILSGYLIMASYIRQPRWSDYLQKRMLRLLPAYVTVVTVCAILLSLLSVYEFQRYFVHSEFWKYLCSNLVFLNFLQSSLPGVFENNPLESAVNGSLWTIKIEVAFYLNVPIFYSVFKMIKSRLGIFFFLIGMYLFSIVYCLVIKHIIVDSPHLESLLFQYPAMFQYFSLGMMVYLFQKEEWIQKPVIVGIGLLFFLEKFLFSTTFLWPIGLAILVFAIGFKLKDLATKVLKGNDYSYSIYIWHYPIAQTLIALGIFQRGISVAMSVYIALVSIIAYISWHYLEKRFLKSNKPSS